VTDPLEPDAHGSARPGDRLSWQETPTTAGQPFPPDWVDPDVGGPLDRASALRLLDQGAALLASAEFAEAARHYRRVIGFDEAAVTAAALLGLGEALHRLDRDDAALSSWEQVVALPETPSTYPAWRNVAAARVRAGDLRGAMAAYREADRRAPADDKLEIASRHNVPLLADEVYGELGYDGPVPPMASLDPDAPVISFSSLSKAYLAPGWRAGWLAVGRSPRLDDLLGAIRKLADGRLCSPGPMQHAVHAALTSDRSHQKTFIDALKARAAVSVERLNAIEGITCVPPESAFYVMPKVALPPGVTDEDYIVALLRETGVLCVYGSGFGLPAGDGFFRVVFLAPPDELHDIYDLIAAFTPRFVADAASRPGGAGVSATR